MKIKFNFLTYALFLTFLVFNITCGTMSARKDGLQSIFIKAPADSHIYLNGEKIGETFAASLIDSPAKDPNKNYKLRIEKDGYEPKEIEVKKEIHSLFGWNLIFLVGAPIGFVIDYFTGEYQNYSRWTVVDLDQKSNFKVDLTSETNRNYIQKRDADKELLVDVRFANMTSHTLEKLDESGKPLPKSKDGNDKNLFMYPFQEKLSKGSYLIKGDFAKKEFDMSYRSSTTTKARKSGEKLIQIPGGGVGVVCGTMDLVTYKSSFHWIHIPEFISSKLAESKDVQKFYLASHCDQIFNLKEFLSQI